MADEAEQLLDAFELEAVTKARVAAVGYIPSMKACEPGYESTRSALLTAMRRATTEPSVPDGWQLVPKVPTHKMKQAGYVAWLEADKTEVYGEAIIDRAYAALLAGAPQPPAVAAWNRRAAPEPSEAATAVEQVRSGQEFSRQLINKLNELTSAIRPFAEAVEKSRQTGKPVACFLDHKDWLLVEYEFQSMKERGFSAALRAAKEKEHG